MAAAAVLQKAAINQQAHSDYNLLQWIAVVAEGLQWRGHAACWLKSDSCNLVQSACMPCMSSPVFANISCKALCYVMLASVDAVLATKMDDMTKCRHIYDVSSAWH